MCAHSEYQEQAWTNLSNMIRYVFLLLSIVVSMIRSIWTIQFPTAGRPKDPKRKYEHLTLRFWDNSFQGILSIRNKHVGEGNWDASRTSRGGAVKRGVIHCDIKQLAWKKDNVNSRFSSFHVARPRLKLWRRLQPQRHPYAKESSLTRWEFRGEKQLPSFQTRLGSSTLLLLCYMQ